MANAETNRKAKAPRKVGKLKRIPKASPGKATCERASPTSAIFSRIMREPKYPAATPTKIPVSRLSISDSSTSVHVFSSGAPSQTVSPYIIFCTDGFIISFDSPKNVTHLLSASK